MDVDSSCISKKSTSRAGKNCCPVRSNLVYSPPPHLFMEGEGVVVVRSLVFYVVLCRTLFVLCPFCCDHGMNCLSIYSFLILQPFLNSECNMYCLIQNRKEKESNPIITSASIMSPPTPSPLKIVNV